MRTTLSSCAAIERQRLMASGSSLAVDTGHGNVALLQGFHINSFQVSSDYAEYHDLSSFTRVRHVPLRQQVELSIVSRGPVKFLDAREANHLFFDPINASIDELLELAHVKMISRSQRENHS